MVDIDERVVSMKFDSSDFEKKSKTTLSTLDQLNEKMSFKDAANSSNLNAVVDNVQKIADKAYTIPLSAAGPAGMLSSARTVISA